MVEELHAIVDKYLNDSKFQEEYLILTKKRNATLSTLQSITRDFVQHKTDVYLLRSHLDNPKEMLGAWYAQGFGFMMELNKFSKYHNDNTNRPEEYLRAILTNLNAGNVGQRIELFYTFLLEEQKRLRQGNQKNRVAPRNSAFIISLFAFWLDPSSQTTIYKEANRRGFAQLVKHHYLEAPPRLRIINDAVEITHETDHLAYQSLQTELANQFPQLKTSTYWSEYFGYWLADYFHQVTQQEIPAFNEPEDHTILSQQTSPLEKASGDASLMKKASSTFIQNDPLVPTPEPLLTDLIHEVQRCVLVEESVIRRIYHALLAGHVVLSGPPGTGKTELARLLPEILWRNVENESEENSDGRANPSAYTTRLVTATDEWSVRTLISGIAPVSKNGSVAYKIQYGHLTSAILKNWSAQGETPEKWSTLTLRRTPVTSHSGVEHGIEQIFRGQWLVIDEFNRAPIDLALGEALTALGGNDVLRVMTEDGSMELPIPKDFRVIGTLNSFDRNYLNQISEALKRRFSFVEILPPGRSLREAEQAIVLYKALERVSHLSKEIVTEENGITWNTFGIEANPDDGQYAITWPDEPHPFREAFEVAWRVFETIRVYRQLGTAQAIGLVRHMLIAGILQGYTTREQWIGEALDAALCDTIADQLQVLLPDEIETLLLALTSERAAFSSAYHRLLANLADRQQRLYGQLLALGRVSDEQGVAYFSDEEIEASAQSNPPTVAETKLRAIFHLDAPLYRLPQFTRRLRAFKAERGL